MNKQTLDDRHDLFVPGEKDATIKQCILHFIQTANDAIKQRGAFFVALSGGSTPKAIFQGLAKDPYSNQVNWSKVHLFWSDERAVSADHPDSNYRMAMEAGFSSLSIPESQIYRMKGESDIEASALEYETTLSNLLPDGKFDLLMLGMGDDGHTASLFPETHALHSDGRKVVANFIPKFDTWRMTLTFPFINQARQIVIYILGAGKAEMISRIINDPYKPDILPLQAVGTRSNKALIIADQDAASLLKP